MSSAAPEQHKKQASSAIFAIRAAFIAISAIAVMAIGLMRPYHNWDMIGYVAAAYHKDGYRGEELSQLTFNQIKTEVSASAFEELTSGEYKGVVFSSTKSLEQQIPFYSIRVAYVELIRQLSRTGISLAKSTYAISAIFAALSVLVLSYLLIKTKVNISTLPIIIWAAGLTKLARFSTPDAIACFASLLGVAALLANSRLALIVAALMPAIRTDFILFSLIIAAYELHRGKKIQSLASIAAAVLLYFIINKSNNNYGWLTIFNFTLISITPYPADLVPSSEIARYIRPYAWAILDTIKNPSFPIYAWATYIVFKNRKNLPSCQPNIVLFAVMPLAFVFTHLLLFPAYMHRFFVSSAALIFILLLIKAKDLPALLSKIFASTAKK